MADCLMTQCNFQSCRFPFLEVPEGGLGCFGVDGFRGGAKRRTNKTHRKKRSEKLLKVSGGRSKVEYTSNNWPQAFKRFI